MAEIGIYSTSAT